MQTAQRNATGDLIAQITQLKNNGNAQFAEKKYIDAEATYQEGIQLASMYDFSEQISEQESNIRQSLNQLEVTLRSNAAACQIQMGWFEKCVQECTHALEKDAKHGKLLYRRGKANFELEEYEKALQDWNLCLQLTQDSNSTDSKTIQEMEALIAKTTDLYKKQQQEEMSKMFGQLKDLGNTILSPFGINLNNLKVQKDEKTGGYSMQFGNK